MPPLATLFGSFAVFLAVGVPISFALFLSSLLVLVQADLPLAVVTQQMFNGVNAFTLLAIPFFFLAGNLMNAGGISERLIRLAMALVGHIRGGLGHVNIVVSMIFAGLSGSSTADTAGVGSILIPAMLKRGYSVETTVAITAASSTMGVVIPPSILMVIYGATAGASIGALLIGGALPGLLIGLSQIAFTYVLAVVHDYPRESDRWVGARATWSALRAALLPMGLPAILIGGIVLGVFTPTEAAAVAAVYGLLITVCVYRTLAWRQLGPLFGETVVQFSLVLFCVAGAAIFGWLLAFYRVPDLVKEWVVSQTEDPTMVLLMIVLLFTVLGTFMDAVPAILIFVPIIEPVATKVGIHPIHLGVVVVMTLAMGLVTPPYGLCLLLACGIARVPVMRVMPMMMILICSILLIILLAALIPDIVLIVPKLLVPRWV
ncbi:MAG: TRAP transporter large permease [candidate division NC10 bacterium]|nr:TRAP transporter large permease [candidate division NC10 bacterium]MBI2563696.1 TRAP transporter large permease [candidate division NC10 bacterium]MBI3084883.1 TRAP transporter large permease [candidate division NC10 bacterium]